MTVVDRGRERGLWHTRYYGVHFVRVDSGSTVRGRFSEPSLKITLDWLAPAKTHSNSQMPLGESDAASGNTGNGRGLTAGGWEWDVVQVQVGVLSINMPWHISMAPWESNRLDGRETKEGPPMLRTKQLVGIEWN